MRSYIKYISLTLLISVLCGALFLYWGYYKFNEVITRNKSQIILLKKGQGLISAAWALKKKNIIDDVQLFRAGVMVSGYDRKLRAGEYLIPKEASMQDVMMILASGKVIQHKVTIIEGWTSWQIADYLNKIENLEGKITKLPAEGSLLPETYIYIHGDSRKSILNRMAKNMDQILSGLWQGRADNLPFKTKEEAIILASIVEKETGVSGERVHVASIFINRLNQSMRLQSDPTIIYGLTRKGSLGYGLKRSEMNKKTAYNTYQINGLPPTAIAHPSEAAIRAVLNPMTTKDLYFVADGTGGHVFSKTLDEHLKNVKKWRKIERQKKKIQNKK
jgi:UPF0755 protein